VPGTLGSWADGHVSRQYLTPTSVVVLTLVGGGAAKYKSAGGWDET